MRKYWYVFKINWQNSLEYRAEFISHIFRGLITFVVLIFIFGAVFRQTENFAGYTFSSMFTYLLMVKFLHFTTRGNTSRIIADEIKDGKLSMYLVKPVGYLKFCFSFFLADRFFEILLRISLIFIFFLLFPSYFILAMPGYLPPFILSIMVALIFNFLLNILIASFAFWVTDIRLFNVGIGLTISFLAGETIPLDILPGVLKEISLFLPFQYALYFPIKLYQGYLTTEQIISGFLQSLVWIAVITIFLVYFWRKGLKRYEAVGQ